MESLDKWASNLTMFGITREQIETEKEKLSKNFKKEAPCNDVIWSLLNNILAKYINSDLGKCQMIYFEMALLLDEEGKDPYGMLYQSTKMRLLMLKHPNTKKVKILSPKGCEECAKLDGKIYPIDKALKEMPIPVKNCKHHNNNEGHGWCRCTWVPVI